MAGAVQQRNLILILARDLATLLATPVFIVDAQGNLVYFNEAAEAVFGRPFLETSGSTMEEWSAGFEFFDEDGRPVPLLELPIGVVLTTRAPAHRPFRLTGPGGVDRHIEATAFPLFAHADEFVGGLAVFWERPEGS